MASTINASTSPAAIVQTADGTGILALQTGNTTAVTIDASQNTTLAGKLTSAGALTLASNGTTTAVTIDTSQNVGIGTASPATKLEVDFSNAGTTLGSGPVLTLKNTAYANSCVTSIVAQNSQGGKPAGIDFINVNQVTDAGGCSGGISFWTQYAGTKQYSMYLDYTGNVMFGTTDTLTSSGPGIKLLPSTTVSAMGIVMNTATNPGTYHVYNTNGTNNGYRFYVLVNGGIANFSANNANLSDKRLKKDITPATNYIDKICSIPVVTFKYKDQDDDALNLGVIAQDVDKVAPELVDHNGFGETPEGETPYLAVYQTDLQYALMKCIQEQQALITSLTARITALEGA